MAFEAWKDRKPFMVKGQRLCIGSCIEHPAHGKLWVTNMDREKLSACWYDNPGNQNQGKPKRRYTFDRKALKDDGVTLYY
jgi:hypothetical protein